MHLNTTKGKYKNLRAALMMKSYVSYYVLVYSLLGFLLIIETQITALQHLLIISLGKSGVLFS